jgi:hypothetical protein
VALLASPVRSGYRATGQRVVTVSLAALALANVRLPGRPATLCPLRALTGIPCPFCGGTTATVDVGHGDVLAALRANPVVVVGALVVVAMPALIAAGAARHVARPPLLSRRTIAVSLLLVVVFSEIWQLIRFGIV